MVSKVVAASPRPPTAPRRQAFHPIFVGGLGEAATTPPRRASLGLFLLLFLATLTAFADSESDYYELRPYPLPDGLQLEASGLAALPDGRLAVAIRKGEVWILENPTETSDNPDLARWRAVHCAT
jgi:hypothetical protein